MERRGFPLFFFFFILPRYRVTKKARLIFSGSFASNLLRCCTPAFLGKECRNLSPEETPLFHESRRERGKQRYRDIYRLIFFFFLTEDFVFRRIFLEIYSIFFFTARKCWKIAFPLESTQLNVFYTGSYR